MKSFNIFVHCCGVLGDASTALGLLPKAVVSKARKGERCPHISNLLVAVWLRLVVWPEAVFDIVCVSIVYRLQAWIPKPAAGRQNALAVLNVGPDRPLPLLESVPMKPLNLETGYRLSLHPPHMRLVVGDAGGEQDGDSGTATNILLASELKNFAGDTLRPPFEPESPNGHLRFNSKSPSMTMQ